MAHQFDNNLGRFPGFMQAFEGPMLHLVIYPDIMINAPPPPVPVDDRAVQPRQLHIYPAVGDNLDMMINAPQRPVPGPVDRADQAVMRLLTEDRAEIEAGCSFTQDDEIRVSGRIFLSQYIQLLRSVIYKKLLHSCDVNVERRHVNIETYVLLLRRLCRKLEPFHPVNHHFGYEICNHPVTSCTINHEHHCPYDFVGNLINDLIASKDILKLSQVSSDDNGIFVIHDPHFYVRNLQLVVAMLRR